MCLNIAIQFYSMNIEDVFSPAEKLSSLRRWNELKIQMRDLDQD